MRKGEPPSLGMETERMKTMVKVTRIPLICVTEGYEYKDICNALWALQNEVRAIKNKAVQLMWEWHGFSSDYKKEHGAYPPKELIGCKGGLPSFLYDRLKHDSTGYTINLAALTQDVMKHFQAGIADYLSGKRSIIEYKSNQPIELANKSIKLMYDDTANDYYFTLSLFSKAGAAQRNMPMHLNFRGIVKDKSTRDILNRCLNGTYKVCGSKLLYDKKKRMFCLNLSYGFEAEKAKELDSEKILGIDLGVAKPFMASCYGDKDRIFAEGGKNSEIEVFRRRIEARRISMLKQGKMCGDGRIGHGRKTRIKPIEVLDTKIQNFRNTMNHKYSRAIVDYAVKHGCGIIQMEDLTGIAEGEQLKYLKNWSYYDLQSKIENKAAEKGIKVRYVDPSYTSQRCSRCGFIEEDNRPEQARFVCQQCGYEENADYNASQNLALPNIADLIQKRLEEQGIKPVSARKTGKTRSSKTKAEKQETEAKLTA